ncbi:hypothetical protein acsn021_24630 [Anaerocolumna cellulosilytica]|uniref:Uncharacterized protein n=1 Tax=Anaerocolumna cellulosilytica TaxID=433286 RepID=A0A6S6QWA1_9FIRM|nr:hypothetical protein [Anaerocolumna cellulosilytica]MBB5193890.1 metal-dependent hydrolase (beta-lactamase superfamily II) [Anaerocolumna cellulosilytica]BCJ94894.1 hypothetical protein acsn021_24630 [Anaerocolumna cellulosilytica]
MKNKLIFYDTGKGDSSIIQFYDNVMKTYINILFDMGKNNSLIFDDIKEREITIHGIVVTHTDEDHISGIISLLKNNDFIRENKLQFVVFNDFNNSLISYRQGNELKSILETYYTKVTLINSYTYDYQLINEVLNIPILFMSLESRDLYSNLKMKNSHLLITFLTPNEKSLAILMKEWKKDNLKKGTGRTGDVTNRSSIACLIEFKSCSILMTADQHMDIIYNLLINKKEEWALNHINYIKISHHGSKKNNTKLLEFAKEFMCEKMFLMRFREVEDKELLEEIRGNGIELLYDNKINEIELEETDE